MKHAIGDTVYAYRYGTGIVEHGIIKSVYEVRGMTAYAITNKNGVTIRFAFYVASDFDTLQTLVFEGVRDYYDIKRLEAFEKIGNAFDRFRQQQKEQQ